jgi:hypothetical protein
VVRQAMNRLRYLVVACLLLAAVLAVVFPDAVTA